MVDKIYRIEIVGYVLQKDYMDTPDVWDWSKVLEPWQGFVDTPNITITKMVESTDDNE